MTVRRFYAPQAAFAENSVVLDEGEARHLRDVLRLRAGDAANVFDGEGNEYNCRIEAVSKRSAILTILGKTEPSAPESPLLLTVAAAVTPPEKYDLVVQKAVELGVTHFIPLITNRTEIKSSIAEKRVDRWRKIAFEASKQCGRAKLMSVAEPVAFEKAFGLFTGTKIMFSERDGHGFDSIPETASMTIIFGPKGGWDDKELETAKDNDAAIVTFGGRILRAETAAIALTAIIQHRFGDMN